MRVIWTIEAQRDRADVWDYIAADNAAAAAQMDAIFSDAAVRLADHPKLGRLGTVTGTRELIPQDSYRLVHEIERDTIWILALVHTSRQWPPVHE